MKNAVRTAAALVALAFGRTSYFEQAVPPEPFEHGGATSARETEDGVLGEGIEEAVHAIE